MTPRIIKPTRHIVQYSGGINSWATAWRVRRIYEIHETTFLFADTLIEDEDNYRFIRETCDWFGVPATVVSDGRTPWELFMEQHYLGNSRVAPCSKYLKQIPSRRWVEDNCDPDFTVIYIGIDWSEEHRIPAIRAGWAPWQVKFPLTHGRFKWGKDHWMALSREYGIEPPRMYELGYQHANCGGTCVRAGQAQWVQTLRVFPDRYAAVEDTEQRFRAEHGDYAILTEQRRGVRRPLPLLELRTRVESQPSLFDEYDWGGCGCANDFEAAGR